VWPAAVAPEPSPAPHEGASVEAVMRSREASRARVFFRAVLVIDLLVLAFLPLLPGAAWLRLATAGFAIGAAAVCGTALWIAKDEARYTPRVATWIGVLCGAFAIGVVYYLGLYSASSTIFTVGIYFFGSSQDRRVARTTYATIALLYFGTTAAIASDLLPDLAVFPVTSVPHASRWYRVVMEQVIFMMVFYLARSSRRATETALESVKKGERELRQREAQLAEARGELDRAMRAGDGRYTGQVLGGYKLGAILGRGGMGEVYAAKQLGADHEVAIKLLHPDMLDNQETVARFMREAQAAAAVPTEHVARMLEVGHAESGVPFIVMELLEGHDLAWYLRRTPVLALKQVVEMVEHTARALSAVRDAGVVHRDLKPGNLFLTDSLPRRWKVLDFGLSKIHGAEALTKDNAVGTPSYMAPEQIRGQAVDHLADLYSLTAIAYRAITGRPPFMGDQVAQILMDVLTRMPPHPGDVVHLPIEVELVLAIGLAKNKGDRFSCVEDLAVALRRATAGELDDETRAHGWNLLKQHPWNSKVSTRA
jgi:serine/threonine-protein kinase